ncbi:cystathionine beta-lyase/cystathionine gamma-synthase [Psychrobacillus sp. L3]|uniref:cystathionine beta-lyase/cystathionine gamma-synthase n=1 Tax=Psychrobacillus sp. L3 TaxID=3236891 RepID=UPI0036F3B925
MGIKKESIAGSVMADNSTGYDSYIIANSKGQIKALHEKSPGYIALFHKTKDGTSQYHYKRNEIEQHIDQWTKPDSYISMNTFYTPKRLVTNLKEIRTAFVDIDCQNIGQSAELTGFLLKRDYFGKTIPTPNMLIYSGRGLNLVWFLEPLSGLAVERWGKLQNALYETMKSFGADKKASDAARVFRIAGTINSKSKREVFCEMLHENRYTFDEIVTDYFPNIIKTTKKAPQRNKKTKGTVKHLFNEYTLLKARMSDLNTLSELRNGQMDGCREYALFLCRYWALTERDSKEQAKEAMLTLNNRFSKPLKEREALADTKSAERYYEGDEPFKIKNETLIEWLGISSEEQKHLKTIINSNEKRRRDKEYQKDKRREEGAKERSEYEASRKIQKAKRLEDLRLLKREHPKATQRELATLLGVALPTLKKYLVELR